MQATALIAALLVGGGSAPAGVQTLQIDMPTAPLGVFGQQYLQDFFQEAPDEPLMVTDLRIHVEFDTEAGFQSFPDAADILFQLQLPTTNVPFWDVSGADLGWKGTGEFVGDLSTDQFNGKPLIFDPDIDFLLWLRRIVSLNEQNPLLGGQLTNSYWEVDLAPVPSPGAAGLLLLAGGVVSRRRR